MSNPIEGLKQEQQPKAEDRPMPVKQSGGLPEQVIPPPYPTGTVKTEAETSTNPSVPDIPSPDFKALPQPTQTQELQGVGRTTQQVFTDVTQPQVDALLKKSLAEQQSGVTGVQQATQESVYPALYNPPTGGVDIGLTPTQAARLRAIQERDADIQKMVGEANAALSQLKGFGSTAVATNTINGNGITYRDANGREYANLNVPLGQLIYATGSVQSSILGGIIDFGRFANINNWRDKLPEWMRMNLDKPERNLVDVLTGVTVGDSIREYLLRVTSNSNSHNVKGQSTTVEVLRGYQPSFQQSYKEGGIGIKDPDAGFKLFGIPVNHTHLAGFALDILLGAKADKLLDTGKLITLPAKATGRLVSKVPATTVAKQAVQTVEAVAKQTQPPQPPKVQQLNLPFIPKPVAKQAKSPTSQEYERITRKLERQAKKFTSAKRTAVEPPKVEQLKLELPDLAPTPKAVPNIPPGTKVVTVGESMKLNAEAIGSTANELMDTIAKAVRSSTGIKVGVLGSETHITATTQAIAESLGLVGYAAKGATSTDILAVKLAAEAVQANADDIQRIVQAVRAGDTAFDTPTEIAAALAKLPAIVADNPKAQAIANVVNTVVKAQTLRGLTSELVGAKNTALDALDNTLDIGRKFIAEPVVVPRASTTRPELPTVEVPQDLHHGTRVEGHNLQATDPVEGASRSELGTGHYLTTDAEVAKLAAQADSAVNIPPLEGRLLGAPKVLRAELPLTAQLIDAKQATPAMADFARQVAAPFQPLFDSLVGVKNLSLVGLTDLAAKQLDEAEALEFQRHLALGLREHGYDGAVAGKTVAVYNNRAISQVSTSLLDEVGVVPSLASRKLLEADAVAQTGSDFSRAATADAAAREAAQAVHELQPMLREAEQQAAKAVDNSGLWDDPLDVDNLPPPQSLTPGLVESGGTKLDVPAGVRTQLEELAEKRRLAMEAQAAMYANSGEAARNARATQQYYETMVWDAGKRATLSPQRVANTQVWLANNMGIKVHSLGLVREPLLNMKRLAQGMLREVGVYNMTARVRQLDSALKTVAKERGVDLKVDDIRRLLEEGMAPQRLAVYGDSLQQQTRLATRQAQWVESMLDRGFKQQDIDNLLEMAQPVVSQFDEVSLVAKAVGVEAKDLVPRAFTDDGLRAVRMVDAAEINEEALRRSAASWEYLPEDHKLASKLLRLTTDELDAMIADPVEFSLYLSKLKPQDLDLLVDSGVLSKLPATTTHVSEFLSRRYGIPMTDAEMFITDPLATAKQYVAKLEAGAVQSGVAKYITQEGAKDGWAIPKAMVDADPQTFQRFVPLREVPGLQAVADDFYVHPEVANTVGGILKVSSDAGAMHEAAKAYQVFTSWFGRQVLANPVTGLGYLSRQFMGNLLAVAGRGVAPRHFLASVIDVMRVATRGLDALDASKAFRYIDGKTVTHRETVARTLRMFNADLVPGGVGKVDLSQLNPIYTMRQLEIIKATAKSDADMAKELVKLFGAKLDALTNPTANFVLNTAKLLDMAAQLAIVRGMSDIAPTSGQALDAIERMAMPWATGKKSTWQELTLEVKRALPQFDDLGRIPAAIARVVPFSSWAMANLPLQLKDMMRNPSRWANYMRAVEAWNAGQTEDRKLLNGEMQDWEREQYGMVMRLDPTSGNPVMFNIGAIDPRAGALEFLRKALGNESYAEAELRVGVKESRFERTLREAIAGTYARPLYELISGKDPLTGQPRDASEYSNVQFANIPMPAWTAALLSGIPVLDAVDRLPVISGTKAVLDPRTGAVVEKAVDGWLGNRGTRPSRYQLNKIEATAQFIGAPIRIIDRTGNMLNTEADTDRAITELKTRAKREQLRLKDDTTNGTLKADSPQYKQRVEAIHRMIDARVQLEVDLKRIQLWGIANQVPSKSALAEYRKRKLTADQLPLPGDDYLQQKLDEAYREKR